MHTLTQLNADAAAFSISEFCHAYRVGRTTAYRLISEGKLRAVKCGRRTLIMKTDAESWSFSLQRIGVAS